MKIDILCKFILDKLVLRCSYVLSDELSKHKKGFVLSTSTGGILDVVGLVWH
jgi:hypothetical protein